MARADGCRRAHASAGRISEGLEKDEQDIVGASGGDSALVEDSPVPWGYEPGVHIHTRGRIGMGAGDGDGRGPGFASMSTDKSRQCLWQGGV